MGPIVRDSREAFSERLLHASVTARSAPQATAGGEVGVVCVVPHPGNVDHVVVCTRSPTVYLMTLQGQARPALTAY